MGSLLDELLPHPDSKPGPVERIRASIRRERPEELLVQFELEGDLAGIRLGRAAPSVRTDELWKGTCFECFVGDAGTSSYREYNLAPLGAWAAYDFESYREGVTAADVAPPCTFVEQTNSRMILESTLAWRIPPEPRPRPSWRIALSAVIEEADGTKSYWALAHPPGKPDFHHPDCFTLELPPPEQP